MIVAPGSAMIVAPGSAIIAGPASASSCPCDDPACVEQNSDTESFLTSECESPGMIVLVTVHTALIVTVCSTAKRLNKAARVKFTEGRRQLRK